MPITIDIAEDLITSTSEIKAHVADAEALKAASFSEELLTRVIDKADQRSASMRDEILAPKLLIIVAAIYFEEPATSYWAVDPSVPVAVDSFLAEAEVEYLEVHYRKVKQQISNVDATVAHYQVLAGAFNYGALARVVRFQWYVTRLRLSMAALHKGLAIARADAASPIDHLSSDLLAVAAHHQGLEGAVGSNDLEKDLVEVAGMDEKTRCNVQAVPFDAFAARSRAGLRQAEQILLDVFRLFDSRLTSVATSLKDKIPDYQSYVVSVFDPEKIKTELLGTQWENFVVEWSGLNKIFVAAKACETMSVGNFVDMHAGTAKSTAETLQNAKDFIGVVSTASLILESLPSMPMSERYASINNHLVQSSHTGVKLPTNLLAFLEGEKKKSRKALAASPTKKA